MAEATPRPAQLRALLVAAWRVVLWRRPAWNGSGSGWLLPLLAANLLLDIASEYLVLSGPLAFDPTAVRDGLAELVPLLAVGLCAAWAGRDRRWQWGAPLLLLAVEFWCGLSWFLLWAAGAGAIPWFDEADHEQLWAAVYDFWLAWWCGASALGLLRLVGASMARGIVMAAALAGWFAFFWWLPGDPYWIEAEAPNVASHREPTDAVAYDEDLFHRQPQLMEQAVSALLPERPGITDLYFVGVAAYAEQGVFRQEVEAIADLFERRFDAAGRTLRLINHTETADRLPMASAPQLADALRAVAARMNPEEDILFLYLSTHGSENHELAVSHGDLHLRAIDGAMLRRMLDEAGIRWRAVAISACYSGGFIPALRDEQTLIMTAADADHPSFGCDNLADFTYFGKHLFDEALRNTHSFQRAFEEASATIRKRELAEGEEPSNPQIFLGRAMRVKLAELERRVAGAD